MKDQMEPALFFSVDPSSFILPPSSFAPWLLVAGIAALGGAIGSFLNVVVYRLSAGLSVVHPGSHCPKCHHPIRWFDNVPVLGWLFLRGRCRDCHAPISIRYPLVEAATMAMFLLLAFVELFSDWADIGEPALWAIYALHALLMSTLLAAALIECDGERPPAKLFWPIIVLYSAVVLWPATGPGVAGLSARYGLAVLTNVAVGAVLGWLLGLLRRSDPIGLTYCLVAVGLVLGGPAAFGVALLTAVLGLPMQALSRRPLPWTAWLALGALAWIIAWMSFLQPIP